MTIKISKSFSNVHCLWVIVLLTTLIIQWAQWGSHLRYDRELIADGQLWLLLSGHFVHLNWSHWALNMGGLAIVAYFFSAQGALWHWLSILLMSAVFVGLGLYWFHPEIGWYVGLSGVLHGLFLFGVIREIKLYPVSGYVLLLLLVGKLGWEVVFGALPGSQDITGGSVITDAHLYGAVGGVFCTGLIALVLKYRQKSLTEPMN